MESIKIRVYFGEMEVRAVLKTALIQYILKIWNALMRQIVKYVTNVWAARNAVNFFSRRRLLVSQ